MCPEQTTFERRPGEQAANMRLIVQAVNAHDELVEALKLAKARYESLGYAGSSAESGMGSEYAAVCQALAAAGEGEI